MKIDLHLHTLYGSACAYMDADQLIRRAKAVGLDGVCITEHDHLWEKAAIERLREKHAFLVIGGVEVGTDQGEILVFGLHQPVREIIRAEELRKRVDEAGGFMILAHPFRYEPGLYDSFPLAFSPREKVVSPKIREVSRRTVFALVDALEVFNGRAGRQENAFTQAVAAHLNLGGTGGSDAHAVLGIGSCYTRFFETVYDEKDLIAQLKKGNYQAVDARWALVSEEEG